LASYSQRVAIQDAMAKSTLILKTVFEW